MTRPVFTLAIALLALWPVPGAGQQAMPAVSSTAVTDPPRDMAHPARNIQLLVPSHGQEMNALFFLAAGEGPKPTMVLLHGLPGNERNLDLAQAVRRAGWNVLTFTYRGAWGSPGDFSIAGAIADAGAALDHVREDAVATKYGVDRKRLVIAGHSMGGLAAAMVAKDDPALAGVVLLDAWNAGPDGDVLAAGGAEARKAFEAGLDDLGHSLKGATPASMADEVLAHRADWNLTTAAPALARHRMLDVYAAYGIAASNRALVDAIRSAGSGDRLTSVELPSDHSFADHRIALAGAVVAWLEQLAPR